MAYRSPSPTFDARRSGSHEVDQEDPSSAAYRPRRLSADDMVERRRSQSVSQVVADLGTGGEKYRWHSVASDQLAKIVRLQIMVRHFLARRHADALRTEQLANEMRRANIAKEILQTEELYVDQLSQIVDLFLDPLKKRPEFAKFRTEVDTIFSCTDIIRNFNSQFRAKLRVLISNWSSTQALGAAFMEIAPWLRVYTSYVNNYNNALETLSKLTKHHSVVATFIEQQQAHPGLKNLKLTDLLIVPIQRIPRYELLLKEMLKYTKATHGDYADLTTALDTIKAVASSVNDKKREAENMRRVIEVRDLFRSDDAVQRVLVKPSRRFVREAILLEHKSNTQRTVFLFNDLILVAKAKKNRVTRKATYRSKLMLDLNGVQAMPLSEPPHTIALVASATPPAADGPDALTAMVAAAAAGPSTTHLFSFASATERDQWLLDIRKNVTILQAQEAIRRGHLFWLQPWVTSSEAAPALSYASAVVVDKYLYVAGGMLADNTHSSALYRLNCDSMKWKHVGALPMRLSSAALAVVRDRLYLFGGNNDEEVTGALLSCAYDAPRPLQFAPVPLTSASGPAPPELRGHTVTVYKQRLYLYGGRGAEYNGHVYCYDVDARTWSCLTAGSEGPAPALREWHCASLWHHYLVVFGGVNDETILNDVWLFDLESHTWTELHCTGYIPAVRFGHAGVVSGNSLFVFGGTNLAENFGMLYQLELDDRVWSVAPSDGEAPSARHGLSCVRMARTLMMFGGQTATRFHNDVFVVNLRSQDVDESNDEVDPAPKRPIRVKDFRRLSQSLEHGFRNQLPQDQSSGLTRQRSSSRMSMNTVSSSATNTTSSAPASSATIQSAPDGSASTTSVSGSSASMASAGRPHTVQLTNSQRPGPDAARPVSTAMPPTHPSAAHTSPATLPSLPPRPASTALPPTHTPPSSAAAASRPPSSAASDELAAVFAARAARLSASLAATDTTSPMSQPPALPPKHASVASALTPTNTDSPSSGPPPLPPRSASSVDIPTAAAAAAAAETDAPATPSHLEVGDAQHAPSVTHSPASAAHPPLPPKRPPPVPPRRASQATLTPTSGPTSPSAPTPDVHPASPRSPAAVPPATPPQSPLPATPHAAAHAEHDAAAPSLHVDEAPPTPKPVSTTTPPPAAATGARPNSIADRIAMFQQRASVPQAVSPVNSGPPSQPPSGSSRLSARVAAFEHSAQAAERPEPAAQAAREPSLTAGRFQAMRAELEQMMTTRKRSGSASSSGNEHAES